MNKRENPFDEIDLTNYHSSLNPSSFPYNNNNSKIAERFSLVSDRRKFIISITRKCIV